MNLKEAFRYVNFLENVENDVRISMLDRDHCLKTTKTHHMNAANPDAQDKVEDVDAGEFVPVDTLVTFMTWLIGYRQSLGEAIGKAKSNLGFDVDAAIATNKMSHRIYETLRTVSRFKPKKWKTKENSFKFNVDGDQTQYYYDVDVEQEYLYDRPKTITIMRDIIKDADKVSAKIDTALTNAVVDFDVIFNVNDTTDEVLEQWMEEFKTD